MSERPTFATACADIVDPDAWQLTDHDCWTAEIDFYAEWFTGAAEYDPEISLLTVRQDMATLTVDAEGDEAIAGALADCIEALGTFNQAQNARSLARG